ncbi:MAG: hypothetical protein ACLR2O_07655 [Coprococcus sp.]
MYFVARVVLVILVGLTHGEPSQINAHPHVSGNCSKSGSGAVESEVVGVHNGIIENYAELKEKLLKHGYIFYSQTDTEIVIKLVDYYYKKYKLGPIDAIAKTLVRVRGSYALELMFKDYPGEIWVARKRQSDDYWNYRWGDLCGFRCACNFKIYQRCILHRKS